MVDFFSKVPFFFKAYEVGGIEKKEPLKTTGVRRYKFSGEILQNYHIFAFFEPPQMGNSMIPELRAIAIHLVNYYSDLTRPVNPPKGSQEEGKWDPIFHGNLGW